MKNVVVYVWYCFVFDGKLVWLELEGVEEYVVGVVVFVKVDFDGFEVVYVLVFGLFGGV